MRKLVITATMLCLFTIIAWAQATADNAATANTNNKENLLLILVMVTGVVVVAAVYIILRAITTLSNELRLQANKKKS